MRLGSRQTSLVINLEIGGRKFSCFHSKSLFRNARLVIILFVRNLGRVCSQSWLSVHRGGWVKGHKNCEQTFCEQTGVSYLCLFASRQGSGKTKLRMEGIREHVDCTVAVPNPSLHLMQDFTNLSDNGYQRASFVETSPSYRPKMRK